MNITEFPSHEPMVHVVVKANGTTIGRMMREFFLDQRVQDFKKDVHAILDVAFVDPAAMWDYLKDLNGRLDNGFAFEGVKVTDETDWESLSKKHPDTRVVVMKFTVAL